MLFSCCLDHPNIRRWNPFFNLAHISVYYNLTVSKPPRCVFFLGRPWHHNVAAAIATASAPRMLSISLITLHSFHISKRHALVLFVIKASFKCFTKHEEQGDVCHKTNDKPQKLGPCVQVELQNHADGRGWLRKTPISLGNSFLGVVKCRKGNVAWVPVFRFISPLNIHPSIHPYPFSVLLFKIYLKIIWNSLNCWLNKTSLTSCN